MFLWGFSGSGKTGIAMETVKIKVSHCKEKNKSVRVIVTKYTDSDDDSDWFVLFFTVTDFDLDSLQRNSCLPRATKAPQEHVQLRVLN